MLTSERNHFFQSSKVGRFQFKFKSEFSIGQLPNIEQQLSNHRIKSPSPPQQFTVLPISKLQNSKSAPKLIPERKHLTSTTSGRFEDLIMGKKTYEVANKESKNLHDVELLMGRKVRVTEFEQKRNKIKINRIPVRSPGDKIYKFPEYDYDFFKQDDGFISGSNIKARIRSKFKISKKFH